MTAPVTEPVEVEGPQTSRVEWAPIARVNLLPGEILERRRFRTVQQLLVLVVLLVLAAAGAAFWWSERQVDDARESLAVVQAQTSRLEAEQREYAAVPATLAQVEFAIGARADVMQNDVVWHRFLSDIDAAAPATVYFDSISFTLTPRAAEGQAPAATPGTGGAEDPFAPANGIGVLAISGISGTFPRVSDWMDAVDKVAGLDVTALQSAAAQSEGDNVSFSSSITITDEALSHRYDRKAS
jgi:Tfp pilus assembly protein PilN